MAAAIESQYLKYYGGCYDFGCNQANHSVNKHLILQDNQSMVDVFFNPLLITNTIKYCGYVNINSNTVMKEVINSGNIKSMRPYSVKGKVSPTPCC